MKGDEGIVISFMVFLVTASLGLLFSSWGLFFVTFFLSMAAIWTFAGEFASDIYGSFFSTVSTNSTSDREKDKMQTQNPKYQNQQTGSIYQQGQETFFPKSINQGEEIIDFWAEVYPGHGEVSEEFIAAITTYFKSAGHEVKHEDISFSQNFIYGKTRPFYVVWRQVVRAAIYVDKIGAEGKDLYVSMRLVFQRPISSWKQTILRIVIALNSFIFAFFLFLPIWAMLGMGTAQTFSTNAQVNSTNGLIAYIIAFIILWFVFGWFIELRSLWLFGDRKAHLREQLDEIYRDDIAALGYEVYETIQGVADMIDLVSLHPDEINVPIFGEGVQTHMTRRKPSI